ncbi:hypothetical protein R3P38DRAFT_2791400 [Favolaschia claudopus]|uniref:Uncharacterized protein n=1 Tax=Favolaschia claudopus TaxID=2862362 RepID=A0AAW0AIE6_9AGAR
MKSEALKYQSTEDSSVLELCLNSVHLPQRRFTTTLTHGQEIPKPETQAREGEATTQDIVVHIRVDRIVQAELVDAQSTLTRWRAILKPTSRAASGRGPEQRKAPRSKTSPGEVGAVAMKSQRDGVATKEIQRLVIFALRFLSFFSPIYWSLEANTGWEQQASVKALEREESWSLELGSGAGSLKANTENVLPGPRSTTGTRDQSLRTDSAPGQEYPDLLKSGAAYETRSATRAARSAQHRSSEHRVLKTKGTREQRKEPGATQLVVSKSGSQVEGRTRWDISKITNVKDVKDAFLSKTRRLGTSRVHCCFKTIRLWKDAKDHQCLSQDAVSRHFKTPL